MKLPLEGLRIVAVEQYGAGPFGSQHLAGAMGLQAGEKWAAAPDVQPATSKAHRLLG